MKIFVSYSRKDTDFAEHVYEYFRDLDYEIFTDVNNIVAGDVWSDVIEKNISNCDIFVIILTYAALRSREIEKEILQAQRENKLIIPCIYEYVRHDAIKWNLTKLQGVEFKDKYDLARKLESRLPRIAMHQGRSLSELGRYEEAIECYDKALEIEPNNANAYNYKGRGLGELGRYEEAISCYDKALAIDPTYQEALDNKHNAVSKYIPVLYDRGSDLERSGHYEEAIKSYNRILELAPDHVDAWYHKGLTLSNLKKYQEAIECYDKALAIEPNNANAYNYKGW